jgi:hypothetical protein
MEDAPCPDYRNYHQDRGAQTFGPRSSAEERPPHEDSHTPYKAAKHSEYKSPGQNYREHKPDQPLQRNDYDAGPQPQRPLLFRFPGSILSFSFHHCLHLI